MSRASNLHFSDYFGINASSLCYKSLWLFDMDGTIYKDDRVFDGTVESISKITINGGQYVFITNNSSKSTYDYINKMKALGIEADEENFFTSTQATILYLNTHYPGKTVYSMGTRAFIKELQNSGIRVVIDVCANIEVVLIGFDTELTSDKIRKTCEVLKKDIPYIATNPDLTCPVSFGFIPDCGAICKMIELATCKSPTFIGKPNPVMVEFVMKKFKKNVSETVVVGDRLYTDIETGVNANVTTVCVLTGEATPDDILFSSIKPTFTFNSIKEILSVINLS